MPVATSEPDAIIRARPAVSPIFESDLGVYRWSRGRLASATPRLARSQAREPKCAGRRAMTLYPAEKRSA